MNKKKILLTGATGLLGEHLISLASSELAITATYHRVPPRIRNANTTYVRLDINNFSAIGAIIDAIQPNVIVHTASIGDVDYCQTHKKEATRINTEATKILCTASKLTKTKFVFFSTNAIYDGNNPPYHERSKPNPIDHYGNTKLQAERFILQQKSDALIVRLMTMYGWNNPKERKNPVTWFIHQLTQNANLRVVNDIYNNYLYAPDAAEAIWKLIHLNKSGTYNVAGPEIMSRYELAKKTAEIFDFSHQIIAPVPSSFFSKLAPRPPNTSFNIKKITHDITFHPKSVVEGLRHMKSSAKKGWNT